jgi:hypothetical protein
MAQTNYTPISLYYSTTASAVPVNTNLANGELAINIQDEKLYFKNAAGTVKLLASNATSAPVTTFSGGTTGLTPSTATSGAVTLAGTLAIANGGTGAGTLAGASIVTYTGTETLTNKTLTNPTVTNYVETPYSANSSTAITIALTNGTVQIITLTGNATITMPTAVSGKSFIMFLRQDVTGNRTVTWSTVNWPGGTAPTITTTASKQDIYSFFSDGTSWYGVAVGANYTQ